MLFAIILSVAAGLSTGIGGLVVLLCRTPTKRLMGFSLGFAAGVMLTVSLTDMLPHTVHTYSQYMTVQRAALSSACLLILGMVIALLLEKCIPGEAELSQSGTVHTTRTAALHSAIVTTAAIVLHNLPEGVLTLFTGYASPKLGLTLALAIALHNIPEGIAIAVPVYYATESRTKGALYALLSGLAEPLGAIIAFFIFKKFITPTFLNGLLALIAGIMSFVSISELIPESFAYGQRKFSVLGLCVGIVTMSIGIYLV